MRSGHSACFANILSSVDRYAVTMWVSIKQRLNPIIELLSAEMDQNNWNSAVDTFEQVLERCSGGDVVPVVQRAHCCCLQV